ncbi:aminotransferase class III-fold pyridoxal phosphate-dependent enzyme [Xanthobacter sp. VNH20]|uniref:aminotransferase class III-fold pyridoxal phosphate-dependent enzyme n=1 Tax=Xanthobacter sp. VNH20 TaxID=3156616 RepID=UPI0032B4D682
MPRPQAELANDLSWIQEAHVQHYIQSWSVQGQKPLVITSAQGSWFSDSTGRRYLDFQSQLVNLNLGHQHPAIVSAIKEQAEKLCYIGPAMGNDARSELAELIAEITPGDLCSTFFTTGGAAANENAVRLARHYTGRQKIVARYRSYHGATAGALGLTGDPRHHLATLPGGVVRMFDPYQYRCSACSTGRTDPCPICSGGPHLEEILMYEDPNTVAAVILESIVGTNGIIVPPDGYLQSIREVCDRHGILLILDEVMAGCGRSGKWFACNHWDVVPDILVTAKGLNSGYVPLGAMTVSRPIADWLKKNKFPGGLTYAGHPLACASGVAAIRATIEENIVQRAAESGEYLISRLKKIGERHPSVGDVRGKGLFIGVEFVKNRKTREPLVPFNATGEKAAPMSAMVKFAMEQGLYLSSFSNVLRITPPLNILREDLDFGCEVLDRAFELTDRYAEA